MYMEMGFLEGVLLFVFLGNYILPEAGILCLVWRLSLQLLKLRSSKLVSSKRQTRVRHNQNFGDIVTVNAGWTTLRTCTSQAVDM